MAYPAFSEISRSFAAGWFAAVMRTGVLALSPRALAQRWPWLACPAAVWGLLCSLWLTTLSKTWRGVMSGAIFKAHP